MGREKLPARLIPAHRHLPQGRRAAGQFPAFHGIGQRHFKHRLAGQPTAGFRHQEIRHRPIQRCLDHPQPGPLETAQHRRRLQQQEPLARLATHRHLDGAAQPSLLDLPILNHRLRRLHARHFRRRRIAREQAG